MHYEPTTTSTSTSTTSSSGFRPCAAPFLPMAPASSPARLLITLWLPQFILFILAWTFSLFFGFLMNSIHPMKCIQEEL